MPPLLPALLSLLMSALTLAAPAHDAPAATHVLSVGHLERQRPVPPVEELDDNISAASRRLEVLVEQYNGSREDLTATQDRLELLNARLEPLTRDLERRQQLMDDLLSRMYQRTRAGPTIALFASDDPHDFVDKLLVLHQLADERKSAAAELRQARDRLADARAALDALAAQQERQRLELRTRKATVKGEIAALRQMRAVAYAGGSRFTGSDDVAAPEYVAGPASSVVDFAFAQLGKPYRWGAAGPRSYDCSGLVLAAWNTSDTYLPHNAARQYASTPRVSRDELRPGDLVFFYSPISHVGIYIGNGRMIHAPEFGENVRVAVIDTMPIAGYGRPG